MGLFQVMVVVTATYNVRDVNALAEFISTAACTGTAAPLSKGVRGSVHGQPAIALDSADGGSLWIATTGPPYPLRIELAPLARATGRTLDFVPSPAPDLRAPAGAPRLRDLPAARGPLAQGPSSKDPQCSSGRSSA